MNTSQAQQATKELNAIAYSIPDGLEGFSKSLWTDQADNSPTASWCACSQYSLGKYHKGVNGLWMCEKSVITDEQFLELKSALLKLAG